MVVKEEHGWKEGVKRSDFPKLNSYIEADVAVIGGGITGITCAYLLSKAGKKVALLEKKHLCSGATEYTTAFLTQSIDTDSTELIKMYGKRDAGLIAKSHQHAIDLTENIIKQNKIDCEFMRCSNFIFSTDEKSGEDLKEEARASREIGMNVKLKNDEKLNFKNYGYIEVGNQGKFHPLKYLSALAKIAQKQGALIFEDSEVKDLSGEGPYIIKTGNGTVQARQVIVATYAPFNNKLFFKKAHYDSYVFEAKIPAKKLQEGTYEDTMNPYHYFRVDREGKYDRLIIGGEDHRSDVPVDDSKNFQALMDYTKETFKFKVSFIRKWDGPILETVDGLAFIGPLKDKNVYYATGFSGNGMTYGTLAAHMIVFDILRKQDVNLRQFARIYDAARRPTFYHMFYKFFDFGGEFIHGAMRNLFKYRKKRV